MMAEQKGSLPVYSVLIVGAGQIGAFYDKPASSNILTHAHAFSSHPGFQLEGFFDSNPVQAKLAAVIWKCEAFSDLKKAVKEKNVDVVVLAVPDEYHYSYLEDLYQHNLRLIIVEKPLTLNVAQAERISDLFAGTNTQIAVNYSRRFVPEFCRLRDRIASGLFGDFVAGTGYYGKGLLHNGSHILDLLRYLIGEIKDSRTISGINDWSVHDPSLSVALKFEPRGWFSLWAVDCRNYTIFEIELFFERGRVRIVDSGFFIEEYQVMGNDIYVGYRNLRLDNTIKTSLNQAVYYLAVNAYNYLVGNETLQCSLEDGYQAVRLCEVLKKGI